MTSASQAESRLQQIQKLTEVSRALTSVTSLDELFQLTVDRAADLLVAEKAILLVASEDGHVAIRSTHGVDRARAERFRELFDETLVSRLADFLGAHPESFLGVPLVMGGAIKGMLVVIRSTTTTVAEHDEWLLSALADQAAVALEKTRLDEIAEFREQLIGIVGHDLRNPLSTIVMAARLLLTCEGLGEMETELARKVTRSALVATRLIDQLLDLARSRLGGGIPIERTLMNLSDVCQQVIDEMELAHPDRPVRLSVRGDATGAWDGDRLRQVIANLVGNAVQHGALQSSIELRLDGGEDELVIEVASTGNPIPAAMLPSIFEAFRKGRDYSSRTRGIGLGLFIAQQIVRAHGGSIAVTSTESDGTTFLIRLPRVVPATPSARDAV